MKHGPIRGRIYATGIEKRGAILRIAPLDNSNRPLHGENQDKKNIDKLKSLGWSVPVIWECETHEQDIIENRISEFLGGYKKLTIGRQEYPMRTVSKTKPTPPLPGDGDLPDRIERFEPLIADVDVGAAQYLASSGVVETRNRCHGHFNGPGWIPVTPFGAI
uniref:Uncharacterized protein n=1 Tax=Candidatus Kentrum sp. TC TaxID=2126339 RepID=A0A451A8Y6_9GAMM|nr:MAG: hypothetical protein BECKTC1821F_GA0114240_10753 [Candidatus Kentron sp. TC]